jgi:hypothetical protein
VAVPLRIKLAAAFGAATGLAVVVGFAPTVRAAAAAAGARLGAVIEVTSVAPCWAGVRLRGVRGRLEGVASVGVAADEVEVRYALDGRHVSVRGGRVGAVGPRDAVVHELEAWRARHRGGGAQGKGRGGVDFGGFEVSWKNDEDAPTEVVTAHDVRVARDEAGTTVDAGVADVSFGAVRVHVTKARVELRGGDGGARLRGVYAESVEGELAWGAAAPPRDATAGLAKAVASATPGPAAMADGERVGARIAQVRERLVRGALALENVLEPDATVELGGVRARVRVGDDSLSLGPGTFRVRREGGRAVLELSPGEASSGERALNFRLSVPVAGGGEDVVADVAGGPIGLSTLGVREGDFGLLDVAKATLDTRSHLVLSGDGRRIEVDGEGKIRGLSLRNGALSDEAVRGLEVAWKAKADAVLDGSKLRVQEGEIDLGAIRVRGRGTVERAGEGRVVTGEVEVPLTACQSMLESVPRGLAPKLVGMRMAGSFGLRAKGHVDTARIDRAFRLDWDVSNSCRVTEAPPEVAVARFSRPFKHVAYGPDGERVEIESGPGTPGWAPLSAISRFMEVAVLTTEDGAFHRHHGFDEEAIRNSIRENLRKGRFVRGASTISMQLAKNLYLDRTKNVARKLQEAVLTMYLEQELTKDQILELYLNVVELGPMVYGVGPAARHYFSTSPVDLSLGQALYMASVLPNPKNQHFAAGGAVGLGWTKYLRKLMRVAHARKRISDEDLEDGLRETVVRGAPSPLRAPKDGTGDLPDGDADADGAP